MGKQRAEIKYLNMDAECYQDLSTGRGFLITDPPTFEWEGTKQKAMFGPQSPLYGVSITDDYEYSTRWRCECGAFVGKAFRGEICPYCKKPVEHKDIDPEMMGWIPAYHHKLINPIFYQMLRGVFGKSNKVEVFDTIVTSQHTVDRNGMRNKLTPEDLKEMNSPTPFHGIGITEFRARYYEILKWAETKKPGKKDTIEFLRQNSCKVFMGHIPVYTPALRQSSVSGDSFYFTGIDRQINPLVNLSRSLIDAADIDTDLILDRMQQRVNAMWDINFSLIDGKDGYIRDQITGGALNFSSRNVIIPDPTLRDNEVDLSYSTLHTLLRFQIIYHLMKMNDITLAEANSIWEAASIFDKRVRDIILYILEKYKPRVVINRNPTLNYYSVILMKVRNIIDDYKSYVMSVPLSILPGLNADFDGDILNILGIMDPVIMKMFRKSDPVKYMVTSRDDGQLNPYFALQKGEKVNLYNFCTL